MSQGEKKKLGFRDKIKKMLENDSPRDKKSNPDEPIVKFILTGGNVHSELLVAEAIIDSKDDNNYGMPLPIVCKWFNKSKTDDITEIEGITGAFYQPNADDINTYIIVEAKPILEEKEYQGEVLRKEIGPIVIDKQIQEEVQELLETGKFKIAAKLESMYNPQMTKEENELRNESYSFPKQCTLQIDTEKVQIHVQDDERIQEICPLGQFYPSIKIIKRTNNVFELYFSQSQVYRLQAQSNTHRDVITVALRMFCGKKLVSPTQQNIYHSTLRDDNANCDHSHYQADQQDNTVEEAEQKISNDNIIINSGDNLSKESEDNNQQEIRAIRKHLTQVNASESYEVFVKLNELTKKTVDLEQLRDDLKYSLQELQDDNKKKDDKLDQLDLQLQDLKEKLKTQLEINQQYKSKHSQYMNEKLFLTQELQVIQQELEGKNSEIEEQNVEIIKLKRQLENKKQVIDEEEGQQLNNKIQDLVLRLNQQIRQNEITESLLDQNQIQFNELNQHTDNLQNEVLHFKKKYESLQQEKSIILANDSQNKNISSHHSINIINLSKKEEDSNSDKADNNDTQNTLSGHNNLPQQSNSPPQQFSYNFAISPSSPTKGQSTQIISLQKTSSQATTPNSVLGNGGSQIQESGENQIVGKEGRQINGMSINVRKVEQLQDIDILKSQLQQKIEENHNLTKKVVSLETTLEIVSQAYSQDVKSINSPSKRKLRDSGNEQILQKLVNSLTEMITEKDLALDNQKNINKELIIKIQELSVSKS